MNRGGLVLLTAIGLLSAAVGRAAEPPKIGGLPAERILFLGNSITLHGAKPDIGWTGNWGMAASEKERDYVHVLVTEIGRAAGSEPKFKVRNIADFERGFATYDAARVLAEELEFRPNIVVLAIGENVADLGTDEAQRQFAAAVADLLRLLRRNGEPAIFVRSSFWPNAVKDGILRTAAAEADATFVDIAAVGNDAANKASAERKIPHAGVAAHPGDRGMREIAAALWKAMQCRGAAK